MRPSCVTFEGVSYCTGVCDVLYVILPEILIAEDCVARPTKLVATGVVRTLLISRAFVMCSSFVSRFFNRVDDLIPNQFGVDGHTMHARSHHRISISLPFPWLPHM